MEAGCRDTHRDTVNRLVSGKQPDTDVSSGASYAAPSYYPSYSGGYGGATGGYGGGYTGYSGSYSQGYGAPWTYSSGGWYDQQRKARDFIPKSPGQAIHSLGKLSPQPPSKSTQEVVQQQQLQSSY